VNAKELNLKLEHRLQNVLNNSPHNVEEYEQYRRKIVEQQVRSNISSVYWEQVCWKEQIIRFPLICAELEPFPRDWKICARYKQKLTDKFLDFCQKWQYPIVEEFDLYAKFNQNFVNSERVKKISNTYCWSYLIGEDKYRYHPRFKKFVQTYQIIFTNLIDSNSSEDDEDFISFSALSSWQIPVQYIK
jgi:hypothetical protein